MTVRIVVADNHRIVLSGIRSILQPNAEFEIVGEARNGKDALRLTLTQQPDILLLDICLPKKRSVNVVRELKTLGVGCPILVLCALPEISQINLMAQSGVNGFLMKEDEITPLPDAIQAVLQGRYFLSPNFPMQMLAPSRDAVRFSSAPHRHPPIAIEQSSFPHADERIGPQNNRL